MIISQKFKTILLLVIAIAMPSCDTEVSSPTKNTTAEASPPRSNEVENYYYSEGEVLRLKNEPDFGYCYIDDEGRSINGNLLNGEKLKQFIKNKHFLLSSLMPFPSVEFIDSENAFFTTAGAYIYQRKVKYILEESGVIVLNKNDGSPMDISISICQFPNEIYDLIATFPDGTNHRSFYQFVRFE